MKLSDSEKKKIIAYMRKLQCELNLKHFDVTYDFDLDQDDGACAVTNLNPSYNRGYISFCDRRMAEQFHSAGGGWERARAIVLHEMVHILLSGMVWAGSERWASLEAFRKEHESVTSQITKILVKHI
jgi:hypothetical protein